MCNQINLVLQNARFRLRHVLDPENFANYMQAKIPPKANIDRQQYRDRQKEKFRNYLSLP